MPRAIIALAGTAAALGGFALFLVAFLVAPLLVIGVFFLSLVAAENARRRR